MMLLVVGMNWLAIFLNSIAINLLTSSRCLVGMILGPKLTQTASRSILCTCLDAVDGRNPANQLIW